jgi:hypothetical protein
VSRRSSKCDLLMEERVGLSSLKDQPPITLDNGITLCLLILAASDSRDLR